MNTSKILNVLLLVVVVILCSWIAVSGNKEVSEPAVEKTDVSSAVINTIMTRVSVRAYENREVEDDKIETLLRAAMAAPSSGDKRPWCFVVIKDKEILKTIASHFHTMQHVDKAPLAIVVCADMNRRFKGDAQDYWIQDVSAASENLLLAAHAMGLGAVWCGITPQQARVDYLKELLKLPEDIIPLNVIPIGYPAEQPMVKDKWKPENIHYDTW